MSLNNVIVVSRERDVQQLAHQCAQNVFAADDIPEAMDLAGRVSPDIVVFDHWSSRDAIVEFTNRAENVSDAHVVVVGNGDDNSQIGANFTEKDRFHYLNGAKEHHRLHDLVQKIKRQLHLGDSRKSDETFFSDEIAASASMVGKSDSMLHTLKMIKVVAASQCNPILIVGEMGTGKELAAKAIHIQRCPGKELIAVNCASLSANLLESELFGHEKGAFTSADREKTGLLELAEDGSIFLDEISEMPLELQAKLLRVIQEKTFRRVGGTKEIACKATIIASSNRDLKQAVKANRFRGDLYHRLSIFPIVLSPLRSPARRGDIQLLAEYFLKTSTICPEKSGQVVSITKLALKALAEYDWPGNVRELRNVIERALLLETTDKIGLNSIIIDPEAPEEYFGNDTDEKIKDYSLAKAEQELIARVLQDTNGRKTKAAELLGISRATLYAKVKQYNIEAGPCGQKAEDSDVSESLSEPMAVA